jgi:hypothetical protein
MLSSNIIEAIVLDIDYHPFSEDQTMHFLLIFMDYLPESWYTAACLGYERPTALTMNSSLLFPKSSWPALRKIPCPGF